MNRLDNGRGSTVVRYIAVSAMAHVIWEFAHMPLYDVWARGTTSEIIYNGLHCTVGDVMIASFALLVGVLAGGYGKWPDNRRAAVFVTTIAAGLAYTAFSEWLNTSIRKSWAYSELMPVIPGTELGLSPMLQWIVVPSVALAIAYRYAPARAAQDEAGQQASTEADS